MNPFKSPKMLRSNNNSIIIVLDFTPFSRLWTPYGEQAIYSRCNPKMRMRRRKKTCIYESIVGLLTHHLQISRQHLLEFFIIFTINGRRSTIHDPRSIFGSVVACQLNKIITILHHADFFI